MTESSDFDWESLRKAAHEISARAYAPYSNYHVGAAAVASDGRVIVGCNVENAAYGVVLCAECGVVSDLHARGGGRLTHFVCTNGDGEVIMPCGRCRQLLFEHGGRDLVLMTVRGPRPMSEVLPDAFGPDSLEHVRAADDDDRVRLVKLAARQLERLQDRQHLLDARNRRQRLRLQLVFIADHADDRSRASVHLHRLADDRGIAAESPLPQPVANHDHVAGSAGGIRREERASEHLHERGFRLVGEIGCRRLAIVRRFLQDPHFDQLVTKQRRFGRVDDGIGHAFLADVQHGIEPVPKTAQRTACAPTERAGRTGGLNRGRLRALLLARAFAARPRRRRANRSDIVRSSRSPRRERFRRRPRRPHRCCDNSELGCTEDSAPDHPARRARSRHRHHRR